MTARLIEALRVKRLVTLNAARRMLRLVRLMAAMNVFIEMSRELRRLGNGAEGIPQGAE